MTISLPVSVTWPAMQPSASIPVARANAWNASSAALGNVLAHGNAAALAFGRYGGATAAADLTWASQQANAQQYEQEQMGAALLDYADKLDAYVGVLQSENVTDTQISASEVIAYQQRLATSGFTQQEISDAHLVGMTDADLEVYRQETIAADPASLAGDVLDLFTNTAATARDLGNALLHPYNYAPGYSVSGGIGLQPSTASGNSMVQVYNTTSTLLLANSLSTTTAIDVRARRIDLPADWAVQVSPAQVTLAPGAQTTVTVTIVAGSPVPQGSQLRVAVEGYAGSLLLGGVVVDVLAPNYVFFDGHLRVYIPLNRR